MIKKLSEYGMEMNVCLTESTTAARGIFTSFFTPIIVPAILKKIIMIRISETNPSTNTATGDLEGYTHIRLLILILFTWVLMKD